MMNRNKFISLAFCCLSVMAGLAQKVTTEKQNQKVNGESAEGYAITLEAKKEEVSAAWNKFLKDFGKMKQGAGMTSIATPSLGGATYDKGVLYAEVKSKGENAEVWLGIKESEWEVNDINIVYKDIEKQVYQFGVTFYKDKIQAQIDEATQAYDATTRQSQRLVNQNKDFTIQLSNNEQEKIKLTEALSKNEFEHAVLLQKIENNKLAQDSVARASEQIKKVIELHKERQRKVN